MNLGFRTRVVDVQHPLGRWASWLLGLLLIAVGMMAATWTSSAAVEDRDCSDFSSKAAAQKFYIDAGGPTNDPHQLDADDDGKACDLLLCPCSSATRSWRLLTHAAASGHVVRRTRPPRPQDQPLPWPRKVLSNQAW